MRRQYLDAALAPGTKSSYNSGFRQYEEFCRSIQVPLFPLAAPTLELFVSLLARRVGFKTIKVYLSGLQYFSTLAGWPTKVSGMPTLAYVLRGIRRVQGPAFSRPPRGPILVA